jgi:non-ribosomal peptide synthetase component E (peptide arylation enzyme)
MPGSMRARRRRSQSSLPAQSVPTAPGIVRNPPSGVTCLALHLRVSLDVPTHGGAALTETAASYVCGVADAPLLGDTIGRSLDLAARRWADREALVSPSHGVRWTWRELNARADALAAGLLALGLEPGARIGIWSLNRPEWTLTQFAAAKAGLILVTINPAYRLSELELRSPRSDAPRSLRRPRSRPAIIWKC